MREGGLHAVLASIDVATPVTGSDRVSLLKRHVENYAEGMTRLAIGATGRDDEVAARELVSKSEAFVVAIAEQPDYYAKLFTGSGEAQRGFRSHVTDGGYDKTTDFVPRVLRTEQF